MSTREPDTEIADRYAASVADRYFDDRGGSLDDATVELIRQAWIDGYCLYANAAHDRAEDDRVIGLDEFEAAVRAEFRTGRPSRNRLDHLLGEQYEKLTEDGYVDQMTRAWQHLAMTSHADMFEAMRSTLSFEGIPYPPETTDE